MGVFMTSSEVLQSLGIHSGLLSVDERSFLDELAEIEGNAASSAPHQEEGTVQLNCLIRILYSRSLSSLRVF